jgi:elongation factor 1-gamma
MGQTPGFKTSKGTLLSESAAIAYYIAQSNPQTTLLGSDAEELGKIWQLNLYSETALVQPMLGILLPRMYNTPITPEQEAKHFESLHRTLVYLNDYTAGKTYLVGDCITLTDINLICNLKLLFACLMTREMREKYANLTSYFEAMLKIPQFVKIIGEVKYVD